MFAPQFGQLAAAHAAVEETVRLAQENGKGFVMALALSWLYEVMASQRHHKAVSVLGRCAGACLAERGDLNGRQVFVTEAMASLNLAKAMAMAPTLPGCLTGSGQDGGRSQVKSSRRGG